MEKPLLNVTMPRLHCLLLTLVVLVLAGCATPSGEPSSDPYQARDTATTIDLTARESNVWDRMRKGFAIPNIDTELSQEWTNYYASHPEALLLMARRASKYLYYIVNELNVRGLPTEIALLHFVESAYDPNALSRSSASGLWQFIPSTGRYFNLQQDWWQDQRRDPIASTTAALDYLDYLYEFQGDWHLALASYNMGEGAIKRAIEKNERANLPTDYLSLDLREETRNYVPKLQAFKNLIEDPERYGLTLPPVNNTPYFTRLNKEKDIDIDVLAELAEMPVEDIQALNPGHKQAVILGSENTTLLLPSNKVAVFTKNLNEYDGELSSWRRHTRENGESYEDIAAQYDIPVSVLQEANKNSQGKLPDNMVLIHCESAREKIAKSSNYADDTTITTHIIQPGDTLYKLAKHYNTSIGQLRKLNQLQGNRLVTGKRIRVPTKT